MDARDSLKPALADAVAAEGRAPAFEIRHAGGPATPLVFASPHSGRFYPEDLIAASSLDAAAIRRSEDAFVDVLAGCGPAHGAPLISARYARAYIDVNREPYELDPGMFEDDLPAFARGRTARVAAGLGAIAKVVGDGQEIYARKLTFAEATARIETVHRPYHIALQGLLEEARKAFGCAVLIDWHSMPSAAATAAARGRPASDFVLGDRFGSACAPPVVELVERTLTGMGYQVARNTPYAGGYTTEHYGRPAEGLHALQIEINRSLYLNERTLSRHGGFDRLARHLNLLCEALAGADWPVLTAPAISA